MIKKLNHSLQDTAEEIRAVFQASYAVEAKLLQASDFPPLKRSLAEFLESKNDFFGFFSEGQLAGVVEVDQGKASTHIQSLVVDPRFFRQGIGTALVRFVLKHYVCQRFTVETGLENGPATALYLGFGFVPIHEYDTDHGVRKVRFERRGSRYEK
jgi:ribosomal protein S18 acetylase RimI-like enzyme